MKQQTLSERALILAPLGRDASLAAAMLSEAGIGSFACRSLPELIKELTDGAAFVLVTEEALTGADLGPLVAWLRAQEEWSDLPFVLLTNRGGGLERNPEAKRFLDTLGNVTFLERPFHPTTLVSLARSALRNRRRQYEARARLEALQAGEERLRDLNENLERRVREEVLERSKAEEQLRQAQKMEALGKLTGGVAHDFNNLLTPITGALDILSRRYATGDPRAARLLHGALQSAERAKTLVQRLLGFARQQSLETRPVDLPILLEGMRDLIASSIGPAIELRMEHGAGLPAALADPNQLELAILNLCVNARDAMPHGGKVTIVSERAVAGPRSTPKLSPGLYVRLSVIDTGIGMDEATLQRAIDPFFSTKEQGKGTGLGLSMVSGLMAQLGGGMNLTSAPGKGTEIDLYFPVADTRVDTAGPAGPAPAYISGRSLAILLVDDEDLVRAGTAEMLRDLGHRVVEAQGGAQALLMLHDGVETDAIVSDYKMPGMDGASLAKAARALRPAVPILIITGYTGSGTDLNLPTLAKPFRQADLAAAINALFGPSTVLRLRPHKSS